jgi:outer membrane lipoprotein-sorting protein
MPRNTSVSSTSRNNAGRHVVTVTFLCALLAIASCIAQAQGGVVTSTQNPMQLALLHWEKGNQAAHLTTGSYPIALAFDGGSLWVANAGSNTVTRMSISDGSTLATVSTSEPYGLAYDGAYLWVTNLTSQTVTKVRASDGTIQGTFAVGSDPIAAAFDGSNIWVVNLAGNTVTKLRATDGANLGTFTVGSAPIAAAFDGTYLWVTNSGSNTVTKLSAAGAIVGTYAVGSSPNGIAFDGTKHLGGESGRRQREQTAGQRRDVAGYVSCGQKSVRVDVWVANFSGGTVTKF